MKCGKVFHIPIQVIKKLNKNVITAKSLVRLIEKSILGCMMEIIQEFTNAEFS